MRRFSSQSSLHMIRTTQPHVILSGIGMLEKQNKTHPSNTLAQYIHHLLAGDQWASSLSKSSDEGSNLAILNGTATATSDDGYITSCSVLHRHNRVLIISINGVPGPLDAQSRYRSKLAGISASLPYSKLHA